MADAQLSVEIVARIDGLRDGFNKAIRETDNLDKSTKAKLLAIDKGFAGLATSVERSIGGKVATTVKTASTSVSRDLANMAKATSAASGGIAKGSNVAGLALTDLSRIAQDAPFGFIGIQNNINPLIESFGRLKTETGSTGGALKALGQSLVGPAGLGFAIAAVSAAVLFYQQYQQKANKETKDAKKNTDDYVESLSQLDQVQVKGAQNALRERTELSTLYKVTQDVTLSNKQRNEAVDELQNKYPEYFKNLDDEIIKNGGAKEAYDRLSQSILATARARAAQDLITKNASRQLENEQKVIDLRIKQQAALRKEQEQAAKVRTRGAQEISGSGLGVTTNTSSQSAENKLVGLRSERKKLDQDILNILTDSNILTNKNLQLETAITDQIKQGADLAGKVGTLPPATKTKDVKTLADVLKELNIDLVTAENQFNQTFGGEIEDKVKAYQKAIEDLIKIGFNPASKAVTDLKKAQDGLFDGMLRDVPKADTGVLKQFGVQFDPKNLPKEIKPNLNLKPLTVGVNELIAIANTAETAIEKITSLPNLLSITSEALSDGFSGIGEAIVTGGSVIEAAGSAIQQSFATLLAALGRQFITMGTAKIAAGILASPFGGKLIADGAGLVALGAGLSVGGGIVGGIGKGNKKQGGVPVTAPTAFANGGVIYGPTLGLMGEYAGAKNDPEVVAPLSKLRDIIGDVNADNAVMTTASGSNVTNSNSNSNNYGGGNLTPNGTTILNPQFVVENRFKGGDLLTTIRLAEAKDKRKT